MTVRMRVARGFVAGCGYCASAYQARANARFSRRRAREITCSSSSRTVTNHAMERSLCCSWP